MLWVLGVHVSVKVLYTCDCHLRCLVIDLFMRIAFVGRTNYSNLNCSLFGSSPSSLFIANLLTSVRQDKNKWERRAPLAAGPTRAGGSGLAGRGAALRAARLHGRGPDHPGRVRPLAQDRTTHGEGARLTELPTRLLISFFDF